MNIYDEAIKEVKKLWNGNELNYPKHTIKALERAKKVEELLKYQSNYINSIIDSLNIVIDKSKLSQDMMANELEEMK